MLTESRPPWSRIAIFGIVTLLVVAAVSFQISSSLFSNRLLASPSNDEVALLRPPASRLLLIVVDGLRYDLALEETMLPVVRSLARSGASGPSYAEDPTMTGAGVRTLVTGVPPQFVDVFRNVSMPPVRYQNLIPLLIEAIKEQDQLAARQQGEIERLKLAVGMSES